MPRKDRTAPVREAMSPPLCRHVLSVAADRLDAIEAVLRFRGQGAARSFDGLATFCLSLRGDDNRTPLVELPQIARTDLPDPAARLLVFLERAGAITPSDSSAEKAIFAQCCSAIIACDILRRTDPAFAGQSPRNIVLAHRSENPNPLSDPSAAELALARRGLQLSGQSSNAMARGQAVTIAGHEYEPGPAATFVNAVKTGAADIRSAVAASDYAQVTAEDLANAAVDAGTDSSGKATVAETLRTVDSVSDALTDSQRSELSMDLDPSVRNLQTLGRVTALLDPTVKPEYDTVPPEDLSAAAREELEKAVEEKKKEDPNPDGDGRPHLAARPVLHTNVAAHALAASARDLPTALQIGPNAVHRFQGGARFAASEIVTIECTFQPNWSNTRADEACLIQLSGTRIDASGAPDGTGNGELSVLIAGSRTSVAFAWNGPDGKAVEDSHDWDLNDGQPHHLTLWLRRQDPDGDEPKDHTKLWVSLDHEDIAELKSDFSAPNSGHAPLVDFLLEQANLGIRSIGGQDSGQFIGSVQRLTIWSNELSRLEAEAGAASGAVPIAQLRTLADGTVVLPFMDNPEQHWVLDGQETDVPRQLDLPGLKPQEHVHYFTPKYLAIGVANGARVLLLDDGRHVSLTERVNPDGTLSFISDASPTSLLPNWTLAMSRHVGVRIANGPFASVPILLRHVEPRLEVQEPSGQFAGAYIPVSRGIEDTGLTETWGSALIHRPTNMELTSMKSWYTPNASLRNAQAAEDNTIQAHGGIVFGFPLNDVSNGSDNRKYTRYTARTTGGVTVPFGFKYLPAPFVQGQFRSHFLETGSDVETTAGTSNGFSFAADASVSSDFGGFEASIKHRENVSVQNTAKSMYDKGEMYSLHTVWGSVHTLVLDKPKVRLADRDASGRSTEFLDDVARLTAFARGVTDGSQLSPKDFVDRHGTHYPFAVAYGARGFQRHTYTKESIEKSIASNVNLQSVTSASLSVNVDVLGFGGSVGAGGEGSSSEAQTAEQTLKNVLDTGFDNFVCVGGNGCSAGVPSGVADNPFPVLTSMRPISELLGPPFFNDFDTAVSARALLEKELAQRLSGQAQRDDAPFTGVQWSFHTTGATGFLSGDAAGVLPFLDAIVTLHTSFGDRILPIPKGMSAGGVFVTKVAKDVVFEGEAVHDDPFGFLTASVEVRQLFDVQPPSTLATGTLKMVHQHRASMEYDLAGVKDWQKDGAHRKGLFLSGSFKFRRIKMADLFSKGPDGLDPLN